MPNIQDPNRTFVENLHRLLSVALRAIERDDRQNGALTDLWMMGIKRSKDVVAKDAGKIFKGLNAQDYQNIKPEHFSTWVELTTGWPNDLAVFTAKAFIGARDIVAYWKYCTPNNNRGSFLAAIESMKEARYGIGDILELREDSPDAKGNGTEKYRLGNGREITRGKTVELTRNQFKIMSLLNQRQTAEIGEFVGMSAKTVWREVYRPREAAPEKIGKAIRELNNRLLDTKISIRLVDHSIVADYR